MDTELRGYLNSFVVMLSVIAGAFLTQLVLPTTGEAVNTGSVVLWTALSSLLVGGLVYLAFIRRGSATPEIEPAN